MLTLMKYWYIPDVVLCVHITLHFMKQVKEFKMIQNCRTKQQVISTGDGKPNLPIKWVYNTRKLLSKGQFVNFVAYLVSVKRKSWKSSLGIIIVNLKQKSTYNKSKGSSFNYAIYLHYNCLSEYPKDLAKNYKILGSFSQEQSGNFQLLYWLPQNHQCCNLHHLPP